MELEGILAISKFGVETSMMVSAPVLILGLTAGILISIVQAATQINDASLAFIPKILAVVASLLIFGHWMISKMAAFAIYSLNQIPNIVK